MNNKTVELDDHQLVFNNLSPLVSQFSFFLCFFFFFFFLLNSIKWPLFNTSNRRHPHQRLNFSPDEIENISDQHSISYNQDNIYYRSLVAQDLRSRLFCQKWIVHLWIGIYRNKSTRHTWTTILGFSARKGLKFLAHLGVGISRRFVVTTRLFLPLSWSATDRNFTLSRIGRGHHGDAGRGPLNSTRC